MLWDSRRRAKKKDIDHSITIDDLWEVVTPHCPYLGIPLRWENHRGQGGKCGPRNNSPSLDRIDSSRGYVKGNVIIVSHRANAIKRDATEQELIEMGQRIAQLKMQLACEDMH